MMLVKVCGSILLHNLTKALGRGSVTMLIGFAMYLKKITPELS